MSVKTRRKAMGSINRTIVELKYGWKKHTARHVVAINRTIVELKCLRLFWSHRRGYLSIVPSWNWNGKPWPLFFRPEFYQSYHRGIEICSAAEGSPAHRAINRTIVELKCQKDETESNRDNLSIVPSWNWNSRKAPKNTYPESINRTIVELKCNNLFWKIPGCCYQSYHRGIEICNCYGKSSTSRLSIVPSWNWNISRELLLFPCVAINRTIVELKYETVKFDVDDPTAINRTIVELK